MIQARAVEFRFDQNRRTESDIIEVQTAEIDTGQLQIVEGEVGHIEKNVGMLRPPVVPGLYTLIHERLNIDAGEAADLARNRVVRSPLDSSAQGALALYCAKAGDAECALEAGATAAELRPDDASIALDNAVVRCILGRDAECLVWLDRSVKLGMTRSQIELMPEIERLADDPRFREIVDRAG